jgi:hypothetical protein
VSWPGEPYTASAQDSVFQGGDSIEFSTQHLELAIRYDCVIASGP